MDEREFLELLEKRAKEQEQLIKQMPLRRVFLLSSLWFGQHPWRILIPVALVLSLLFRWMLGYKYYELVLKIFGGFGFIR
ncbi:MAG: hypothetical protein Q8Q49_02185 [bacterium]|nr:hypothetical protein [bacterium]